MKRVQLEEMLADLGYVLLYLRQAQAVDSQLVFTHIEGARELAIKVAEGLKRELDKSAKPKDRTRIDVRHNATLTIAYNMDIFREGHVPWNRLSELYQIVCSDNENWDGEEVAPEAIAKLMVSHYTRFGVRSSIP